MVLIFNTLTGELLDEVRPSRISWSQRLNQADSLECHFPLDGLNGFRNLLSPIAHSAALNVGGRIVGGPILPHDLTAEAGRLQISARGFREAILGARSVLPVTALERPLAPGGVPDTTLDTVVSGVDLGTIGKKLIQQACSWPGSGYPIEYHEDRPGTGAVEYAAIDRVLIDASLTDLSALEGGPDIEIALRQLSATSFGWIYRSGSEAHPRLQSEDVFEWDLDALSALSVRVDPTRMGSISWAQGGKAADRVLVAMRYDPYLVERGFPLLELEADIPSTTSDVAILQAGNAEALRTGRKPWEFWSFTVPADRSPLPFEYALGDLCVVNVSASTPVAGGYIAPGSYTRRIVALSGDQDASRITITCGEVYDE